MKHSFFRAFKFAFKDFWLNIWLSLVTITVLVLALLSVNILVSLNAVSNKIISSVQEKVDISVFFKSTTEQGQIDNFRERLAKMPEVKETMFIPKESALEDFKLKHQDEPAILEALTEVEANPLSDALIIKAQDIEDYNKLLAFLRLEENQQIIKYQNFTDHKKIIDRVDSISKKVEKVSLIVTLIFSIIAVLIVFNAIRVTIYTHREEVVVMRLVGANNWFIRLPFLLESVLYALFSCIITIVLFYAVFGVISPQLASFLETYDFNLVQYYNQHFLQIFGVQLLAVIFLNIISSAVALGRYLKV